jgi:flagellar basal-body rod modification protein FlgD
MTTSSTSSTTISPAMLALLNGTSSASTTTSGTGTANSTGASANSASSIQNQFLTLLTTQLQNQDPLNPMDSSQMTSQLAQISTVSGVQQLNSTMQAMMNSNTALEAAQSAALIGKTVVGPGSSFELPASGGTAVGVTLPSAADTVKVQISDGSGNVVQTLNVGPQKAGTISVPWDGTNSQHTAEPSGSYSVSVTASLAGKTVAATTQVAGVVTGITSNASGINLDVAGVGTMPLSSVSQID